MKRKPDMLWLLVIVFGLGIVTTGYNELQWQPNAANASATNVPVYQSKG